MDAALIAPLTPEWEGTLVSFPIRSAHGNLRHVVTGQCCVADVPLQHGEMACLYDWRVSAVNTEGIHMISLEQSCWHRILPYEHRHALQCIEVCSGIAGTSLGAQAAGVQPLLACDQSDLACKCLKLNDFPRIVHGSISSIQTQQKIHSHLEGTNAGLLAGFPCQPFSQLGSFYHVLDLSLRLQSSWLLLECVKPAGRNKEVIRALNEYSLLRDFHWTEVDLHLDRAWPTHRARWWALLVPRHLPLPSLRDFDINAAWQRIEDVIPCWPLWPLSEEQSLLLDQKELTYFTSEDYGSTHRFLDTKGKAPTFLHSMGWQVKACPCGCRPPFAERRLLDRGLHGILVRSQLPGHPLRHPHPLEVGLLAGLPGNLRFAGCTRGILTQVGQIASPIQSHWVVVQFLHGVARSVRDFPWIHAQTMPTPSQLHRRYLRELLRSHQAQWPSLKTTSQQSLQLLFPTEPSLCIQVTAPLRVHEVLQAHANFTGSVEKIFAVRENHIVHANDLVNTSSLTLCTASTLAMVGVADSLPPLPHLKNDIASENDSVIPTSSTSSSAPMVGFGKPFVLTDMLTTQLGASHGLDDLTMHQQALVVLRKAGLGEERFWTPRWVTMIRELHSSSAIECIRLQHLPQIGEQFAIMLDSTHWVCIHFQFEADVLRYTIYDGLAGNATTEVHEFAQRVFVASGKTLLIDAQRCRVPQTHGSHCGAVALLHLGLVCKVWDRADEPTAVLWHDHLLARQWHQRCGSGPQLSDEQEQATITWLRGFLPGKGVNADNLDSRIKAAIKRLGITTLYEAIHSSNPWRSLKQAGTSNGRPFQWIQPDELEQQIQARANGKFRFQNFKKDFKKKDSKKPRDSQMGLQLTPDNLSILNATFVDTESNPVNMIAFQEVAAEARGVAICTIEQALKLNAEPRNLSIQALAVVSIGKLNIEQGEGHVSEHLQWPAIYGPTNEPILVSGTLLNFGDDEVSYNQPDDAPEVAIMQTSTLRLLLFRDQYQGDWSAFQAGPVKVLVQTHACLQKCVDESCSGRCTRFHPAIEEDTSVVLQDVWSWRWCDPQGRQVQPKTAEMFSVYIRVPESAALPILRVSGWGGFYVEPRSSAHRGTDDFFAVIWLPRFSWDDAIALQRKHDGIIGLARVGMKFGLRVKRTDETKFLQLVFPGQKVISCHVQETFEVGPLPMGVNKQQIITLLEAWQWRARPLRPSRTTTAGRYWEIGTDVQPPAQFLHTEHGTVTVTQKKTARASPSDANMVLASGRTKQHIQRQTQAPSSSSSSASTNVDPLQVADPWKANAWASYRPTGAAADATTSTRKRIDEVADRLQRTVNDSIEKKAAMVPEELVQNSPIIQKLCADVQELQAQGSKYQGWFQELGTKVQAVHEQAGRQEQAIQEVQHGLAAQTAATTTLQIQLREQAEEQHNALTSRLEALLEKRFKSN